VIRAVHREVVRPITRAIDEVVRSGGTLSAFSSTKLAIQEQAADVNILVVSDSTGLNNDRWVYMFSQWLATENPTHSVSYRLWNDGGNVYGSAVPLGTGTGSRTIHVWNAAVSGSLAYHVTGAKQAAAITAVPADLIIFNHGLNHIYGPPALNVGEALIRGELMMGYEAARLAHPNAGFAAWKQNARRDDVGMTDVVKEIDDALTSYGDATILDVYSVFMAQGKNPSLYADNSHPSTAGTALYLDIIQARWRSAIASGAHPKVGPQLAKLGTNLLDNGKFTAFAGSVPDGWSAISGVDAVKDAGVVDGAAPYSVKLTGTAAGGRLFQNLPAAALNAAKGKSLTLAVRQYIPPGSASSVGRIALQYTDGTSTFANGRSNTSGHGGWRWNIIAGFDIPPTATAVAVNLYCDSAANSTSTAYYDRAILVIGDDPRNVA
jgi:hypothetical protein